MAYTLGEAAKATGKSKTSIRRALDSGRISGAKNDLGEWVIEPVELHRVYPMAEHRHGDAEQEAARPVTLTGTPETLVLQAKLDAAERLIGELVDERADLRRRLDAEAEERRKLTALLTDQRRQDASAETPRKPVEGRLARAWGILRGKG